MKKVLFATTIIIMITVGFFFREASFSTILIAELVAFLFVRFIVYPGAKRENLKELQETIDELGLEHTPKSLLKARKIDVTGKEITSLPDSFRLLERAKVVDARNNYGFSNVGCCLPRRCKVLFDVKTYD